MKEPTAQLTGVKDILLGYANSFLEILPAIAIALIVLAAFFVLSKYLARVLEKFSTRFTDDRSLQSLFGTVFRVLMVMIGVFAAAAIVFPGLNAGTLVSVLGLTSVAIGFAFKDIFENFFAGILILSRRPFSIGDQIESNDFEGSVEHISIRNTIIRTFDGKKVLIPNSSIFQNPMVVNTAYEARRTSFSTGISYDADIETAREVMREALIGCEGVLTEPAPQILVSEHGDSSVNFDLRYWTLPEKKDARLALDKVATAVKYALDDHDIGIPYPHRVLEVSEVSKLTVKRSDKID